MVNHVSWLFVFLLLLTTRLGVFCKTSTSTLTSFLLFFYVYRYSLSVSCSAVQRAEFKDRTKRQKRERFRAATHNCENNCPVPEQYNYVHLPSNFFCFTDGKTQNFHCDKQCNDTIFLTLTSATMVLKSSFRVLFIVALSSCVVLCVEFPCLGFEHKRPVSSPVS